MMMSKLSVVSLAAWLAGAGAAYGQGVTYTDIAATAMPDLPPSHPSWEQWQIGGTVADFSGDGLPDLYFLLGEATGQNVMYINQGDLTFENIAPESGLGEVFEGGGASAADYDGDGDYDLFVTTVNSGGARLYRNDGGVFADVTAAAGMTMNLGDAGDMNLENTSVAWSDYDRDGDIDCYVASWLHGPNSNRNRLMSNNGDGTFTDVTAAAGLEQDRVRTWTTNNPQNCTEVDGLWYCYPRGFDPRFVDLDLDGWPDLTLSADFRTSQTFMSNGDGTFRVTTPVDGYLPDRNGMGNAVADYDGDGDFDWFVSSSNNAPYGNALYINDGEGNFVDEAEIRGAKNSLFSWGAAALDYDNDMDVDIFVVNGGFAPQYVNKPEYLFQNDGAGFFTNVAAQTGANIVRESRGTGYLDVNQDGFLDLYITTTFGQQNVLLLANPNDNANHYLRFKFQDTHTLNREQIGALIRVTAGGIEQMREVDRGSNHLSQSEQFVHFGMGPHTAVDEVHIRLPDGRQMVMTDVPVDQTVVIEPPPKGSFDGDDDLDLLDFGAMQRCCGGPGVPVTEIECLTFEFDYDGDVDADDLAAFQSRFTGPN